jgi:hypothetical protein
MGRSTKETPGAATKARKHEIHTHVRSCFRVFVAIAAAVFGVAAPQAAQQQPPAPTPPVPTFRSGTKLIVQTVSVKDKDGKPIEGLTAKDFTVTEEGEPQTISFVEFQRLPGTADSSAPVAQAPPVAAPANPAPSVAPLTQAQILVPPPGDRAQPILPPASGRQATGFT